MPNVSNLYIGWSSSARPDSAAIMAEPTAPANYKNHDLIATYVAEAKVKQLRLASRVPGLAYLSEVCVLDGGGTAVLECGGSPAPSCSELTKFFTGWRPWLRDYDRWAEAGAAPTSWLFGFEVADFFAILAHQAMSSGATVPVRFLRSAYPGLVDPYCLLLCAEDRKLFPLPQLLKLFKFEAGGGSPSRVAAEAARHLIARVNFGYWGS